MKNRFYHAPAPPFLPFSDFNTNTFSRSLSSRTLSIYFFVFFWVFAILSVALTALVNLWWKISIHSCGMGILCSFMVLMSMLYSIDILWLCGSLFVAGAVMTSRCLLGAHTVEQTLTGFGVGLGFGLIPLGLLLCVINNFLTFAAC